MKNPSGPICGLMRPRPLKKSLRGKNFSSENEAIGTVEDYLNNLNSEFFVKL